MSLNQYVEEWHISPDDIKNATVVLKEGQSFLTSLPGGEIPHRRPGELGLYFRDTRFLSCHEIYLEGRRPVLLSGRIRDSHFAQIELSNREIYIERNAVQKVLPLQTVHLRILRVLKDSLLQRLRLINFNNFPVSISLTIKVAADYRDLFEVRGLKRPGRGEFLQPEITEHGVVFGYRGLDGLVRRTGVFFSGKPHEIKIEGESARLDFLFHLPPRQKQYLFMQVATSVVETLSQLPAWQIDDLPAVFYQAADDLANDYNCWKQRCTQFITDNEIFNKMLSSGVTDIRSLITDYPVWGRIVEAGIPWYAVPFGRDSLITSWQTLILNPQIARSTLVFLARLQGRKDCSWTEEKPGKIMHEIRFGEMTRAGEVPHTPYFGSVDSTLWFIILLSEYVRWMNDRKFLLEMLEPLRAALMWCQKYGDLDGDGFIEYHRESKRGLLNQGWKDSWDAVVDREGNIPQGPIALVEVQACYYLALVRAAELFRLLGNEREALHLKNTASLLRKKFLDKFWLKDEKYVIFALDGKKRPVKTTVSNGGYCLMCGILPENMARQVVSRLFEEDMYSGWGIRTMSGNENMYNPMSYHNGSVWPHDNAIIAMGLRRYHAFRKLRKLSDNMFTAATYFPYQRLPELFCGFTRRGDAGPVKYPTACDPQAWAVGSTFLLLRALLGIKCCGRNVYIQHPLLPGWVNEITVYNMRVVNGSVDLEFFRRGGKTYCSILKQEGNVRVIVEP